MKFAKEMLKIKKQLEQLGHEVITPENMKKPIFRHATSEDSFVKIKSDLIRLHYQKIHSSDAILVANISTNVHNYIGGSSFIEMAFAHILNKKIFLLNPIPKMTYTDEILAMKPTILKGDLSKIK